jgi:hypothetical protein
MTILNQFWSLITGLSNRGPNAAASTEADDYRKLYQALYDLYNNNEDLNTDDTTRRLRTVVNRSVEFYASKMLPGEVTPVADDQPLTDALDQVLKSSNFRNNKPAMLRGYALYGDSFVRVRGDEEKSYLEDVPPAHVSDFEEDSRGFLTFIRIDIQTLDENGNPELYTEVWDKAEGTQRIWHTHQSINTKIENLGTPSEENTFASFGIDFIPIVHTKFRDNGDQRGAGCVYHALDKVYEANRLSTRLHDLFFRFDKPIWAASANAQDAAGRPLPAPRINATSTGDASTGEATKESVFGDIVYLPGTSSLDALIPDIRYVDGLAILNAMMGELELDLPELRWYSVTNTDALSGTAIRSLLAAAIDRANAAKENFISSLSRMLEMALTIGIFNGVFEASLGNFDSGDFEHTLQVDDAWGESLNEKAVNMQALTNAGVPAPAAMQLAGFSEEEVKDAFPTGLEPPKTVQMPPGRAVVGTAPQPGTPVVRVA